MVDKKLISIVIPAFNEEENIAPLFETLNPVLSTLTDRYDFELLVTDNHSTDSTFAKLLEVTKTDPRLRIIRYSRNFGVQKSMLTGLLNAKGEAAILFDSDLQDPADLIVDFLEMWEKGHEVVYGVRRSRQENAVINLTRIVFYKVINWLSEIDMPLNAGDFRLVDRKILDLLAQSNDRNPYLRGMITSYGFSQVGVPYDRSARRHGESKIPLSQYFKIAIDGIVSQSVIPLHIATHVGIVVAVLMMVCITALLIAKLGFDADMPRGYPTTLLVILFGISLNAFLLGIIGEYLARIYKQSVKSPLTIIETDTQNDKT